MRATGDGRAAPAPGRKSLNLRKCGTEDAEDPLRRSLLRLLLRFHFAMVERENHALIVVDGAGILPDVAGVVDSTGEFSKVALFDCLQRSNANLRRLGDLFQRDATIAADRSQPKETLIVFHQYP